MGTRLKKGRIGSETKTKVVLEAFREDKTLSQIGSQFKVSPAQISIWRKQAISNLHLTFSTKGNRDAEVNEELVRSLYEQVGRLNVENSWLKKKLQM